MKNNKLFVATMVMMATGLVLSLAALIYLILNQENISLRIDTFERTISKINPINGKDATDEQVLNAIAVYCKQHNDCTGKDGHSPIKGIDYTDGASGSNGANGTNGTNGTNGNDGKNGADSTIPGPGGPPGPGPGTERQCVVVNPTTRRVEWRNVGDTGWQVEYYLSPGQLCPQEVS